MNENTRNAHDAPLEIDVHGARHRFDAAYGLICLGAGEEALEELEPMLGGRFHTAHTEDLRLWAQSMAQGPAGGCEDALVALEKGMVTNGVLQNGYIEALNMDRPMLALRLIHACTPDHMSSPAALHARACAAAQLGFHEQALEDIAATLTRKSDPSALLIDADLAPTWYHYASTEPRLWEAKIITRPEFAQLARVCRSERHTCGICWNTAHTCLPRDLLPFLTRDWTLYVSPGPKTPVAARRRFTQWLNERRRRMSRVLRRAIQRARTVVSAAEISLDRGFTPIWPKNCNPTRR